MSDTQSLSKKSTREQIGDWLFGIAIYLVIGPGIFFAALVILDSLHVPLAHKIFTYVFESGMWPLWCYLGYVVLWPFIMLGIAMTFSRDSILDNLSGLPLKTKIWKVLKAIAIFTGALIFLFLLTSNAGRFNQ